MKLPKITKKQSEILKLLYRYRFLNRIQIQALMGHKDPKRINAWLKDLREKHYVEWIYSTHFAEKTKPAIYFLGLNGVRFLKTLVNEDDAEYIYPPHEVHKRYRESSRSQAFIDRCLLTAECALSFLSASNDTKHYILTTQSEYLDEDNEYHFITDGDLASQLGPQLCITKQERISSKASITTNYLLEIFDATLPRYRIKNRLKQYVTFLTEGDWQTERDDPLPIVLLVCPRLTDLIYAKRRTRGLLADIWDEDRQQVHMRFATVDKVRELGATSKIWEEA